MAAPLPGSPTIAFVYPNSRRRLAAEVEAGSEPDSTLLGQNHLAAFGLDAVIHDPRLSSTARLPARVAWNLRELTLPWELRRVDVAFTALANTFPLAARARRRPRVVVVNYGLCTTYERSSRPRRALLAASLRSAARVVCLGEWQRRTLIAQARLRPEHTHTVLLGVDEAYFSPRETRREGEPFVLAVGKDLARDYRTFVDAVAPLGVRAEIAAYPRNVAGIDLPPNVTARTVSSAELRELYARASCVVIPQRRPDYPYGSEGGGLTSLLEAAAMARATVVSDRPVLDDYVTDGEDALVVPPEDASALRAAIERALGDDALAASLGRAARARVERASTTRRFAEQLAPILRAAAEG